MSAGKGFTRPHARRAWRGLLLCEEWGGGGGRVMLAIISKSDHEPRTNGELEDLGW